MNSIQQASIQEILQDDGYEDLMAWLADRGDDVPQVGICAYCGNYDWDCDLDTRNEYCTCCERAGGYSSLLIVVGMI